MGRMLVIAAVVAAAGACRAPASPVGVEETEPEDRGADGAARGVGGGGPGSVIDSLPDPEPGELDGETASRLVRLSLECVEREYPNKPSGVWVEDASGRPPRELHPAFFGCFDWHSAVHAH